MGLICSLCNRVVVSTFSQIDRMHLLLVVTALGVAVASVDAASKCTKLKEETCAMCKGAKPFSAKVEETRVACIYSCSANPDCAMWEYVAANYRHSSRDRKLCRLFKEASEEDKPWVETSIGSKDTCTRCATQLKEETCVMCKGAKPFSAKVEETRSACINSCSANLDATCGSMFMLIIPNLEIASYAACLRKLVAKIGPGLKLL